MPQIEFPIEMVGVAYLCDECGQEMTAGGPMNWTVPVTYPHTCPNGHNATLPNSYPNTGWRRVAPPRERADHFVDVTDMIGRP